MSIAIHYRLAAEHLKAFEEAYMLVVKMHQHALSLRFHQCSKILTWEQGKDDPDFARLFHYYKPIDKNQTRFLNIPPQRFAVFMLHQPGAPEAAFGLASFPKKAGTAHDPATIKLTGLPGFHWSAYCKTQPAGLPQNGGWANFFRLHDGICRLLDFAKKCGIKTEVMDEGGYFKKRDVAALRQSLGQFIPLPPPAPPVAPIPAAVIQAKPALKVSAPVGVRGDSVKKLPARKPSAKVPAKKKKIPGLKVSKKAKAKKPNRRSR